MIKTSHGNSIVILTDIKQKNKHRLGTQLKENNIPIPREHITQRKRKMTVKKIPKFFRSVLKPRHQHYGSKTMGEPGQLKRSKVDEEESDAENKVLNRKLGHSIPTDECLDSMSEELKQELASRICPNDYDNFGLTPVHRACEVGSLTHLKLMLSLGAMVNISTTPPHGLVPAIMFAATNGHTECVKLLLEHGADVNSTDCWGNTALYKASAYNHLDCVSALLAAGANANVQNRWGAMPLQYAALQGHRQVVKLLLANGASLSEQGEKNVPPPLIAASMRGYAKTVEVILKYHPNLHQEFANQTALCVCLEHFLLSCNGFASAMSSAGSRDRFQCVQMLIHSGSEIKLEILDLMFSSDMIPYLVTEEYVSILRLLLQGFAYNKKHNEASYNSLFEHITRLGRYKWKLILLICSAGFTPSRDQLNHLSFTLTDHQFTTLSELNSNPRPLMDQCRSQVRKSMQGSNVVNNVKSLNLPVVIQDYMALQHDTSYIIL